jgi:hypothetical protein
MREFNRTYAATQPHYGTSTEVRGGLRLRDLPTYLSRRHLLVRHEGKAAGHNGLEEFEIAEFLAQDGAARPS